MQGLAAQHGAEEQPVVLQRLADLDERAGQVVHPVQAEHAHDQVEAAGREGQPLLVRRQHGPSAGGGHPGHGRRKVALDQKLYAAAPADEVRQSAVAAAQVERPGEAALDVVQPIGDPLADLAVQEVVPGRVRRRPVPVPPHRPSVEDVHRLVHRFNMAKRPETSKRPMSWGRRRASC